MSKPTYDSPRLHRGILGDDALPDPFELIRVVRRRWRLISAVAITLVTAALSVLAWVDPYYEATSEVVINAPDEAIADAATVLAALSGDSGTIETEIRVLTSRSLAGLVAGHLNLAEHPEYGERDDSTGPLRLVLDWLPGVYGRLALTSSQNISEDSAEEIEQSRLVSKFLSNLDVERVGLSRVLRIRFTAKDPMLAKQAVNGLAAQYVTARFRSKTEAAEAAHEWLDTRVEKLQRQVRESESQIARLRKEGGIVEGERAELLAEQLSGVTEQLLATRLDRAEADSRYDDARRILESTPARLASSDLATYPEVKALLDSERRLLGIIAARSVSLGNNHPIMVEARTQLEDLRDRVRGKIAEITSDLGRQRDAVRQRQDSLEREVVRLTEALQATRGTEVDVRAFERNAEAARLMLQVLLNRSEAIAAGEEFPLPQVSVLSPAEMPEYPAGPNKLLYALAAVACALIAATGLAFLLDLADNTLHSGNEVESELGVPCFGGVPIATTSRSLVRVATHEPRSAVADATRRIGTLLGALRPDLSKSVVMLTSAMPGEGKSTTAATFARLAAAEGRKVIIIDGDSRQPALHRLLEVGRTPGLVDYLANGALLDEVIHQDGYFGLDIIPAGDGVGHCVDICCHQRKMRDLVLSLRKSYDIVVIDTAPVLAVQDTLILANFSDFIIVTARWGVTSKKQVQSAIDQIRKCASGSVGVTLTMINTRENAKYAFGDSRAYAREFSRYYS